MILPTYFNSKKSLTLFGLGDQFLFLKNLYTKEKMPKVLMLSGNKGSGKSTLINHLMFYIFDKKNYDEKSHEATFESSFYNQFLNDIFPNIIYLSGIDQKVIKIDDIRTLKKKILQTSISSYPRFIIFDDVELFNNNSLNALLKIIEEPSENNFFILINNKSRPLLETIKSRCIDIKVIVNNKIRQDTIKSLINKFNINVKFDPKEIQLTPGQFIKFNYIFDENKILIKDDFIFNLRCLLNLYKKDKDPIFIDIITFLTDYHFSELRNNNLMKNNNILEYKRFVFENVNKFFLYNLNQNALLNNISSKINNE